jgi:hypothetical protein
MAFREPDAKFLPTSLEHLGINWICPVLDISKSPAGFHEPVVPPPVGVGNESHDSKDGQISQLREGD